MNLSYIRYCELLWQKWNNDITLLNLEMEKTLSDSFYDILQLEHCPEPYLVFNQNDNIKGSLVFLTTNPGGGMPEQTKQNIENAINGSLKEDYFAIANKLANYYQKNLPSNALSRIKKMDQLSKLLGYKGFIQVELFPFHSNNLGHKFKDEIIRLYHKGNNPVFNYIQCLKKFLEDKDVIAIAASNNHDSVHKMNSWLRWISETILVSDYPNSYILGYSNQGKPSKSFTMDEQSQYIKGMCLLSGMNNLPNYESLQEISKIVSRIKDKN